MRSLRGCLAIACLAMAIAGLSASAASVHPCGGRTSLAGGGWVASTVPQMSTVALVAGVTYAPDRIYASGTAGRVSRSDDAGCSWTDISPPAPSLGGLVASTSVHVSALAAPSSSTAQNALYIGADVQPSGAVTGALPGATLPEQPYVFASFNAGKTWSSSNNGLPTLGTVAEVAAPSTAPQDAYAVVVGGGPQPGLSGVYFTGDGGATWTQRGTDTDLHSLQINPLVANQLYALGQGGLRTSTDGGQSFHLVNHTSADVVSFSVNAGSGYVQIVQGHRNAHVFDLSLDGGASWQPVASPSTTQQVAVGAVVPVTAVATDRYVGVVQVIGGRRSGLSMTPRAGTVEQLQVSAPNALGVSILGLDQAHQRVYRAVYNPLSGAAANPSLTPVRLLPRTDVKQFPSTLNANVRAISLAAGRQREVPYELLMPRTPSPVDLMFLVDTTASMQATIDGVRQSLQSVVNDLALSGLDVRFGLADFKDYPPEAQGNGSEGDYPYRLRARIGASTAELTAGLSGLKAKGGGDAPEAQLTALYQSTTGVGQLVGGVALVEPHAEANYRTQALKLALIATDAAYHQEPDYPTPAWSRVAASLTAAGVHQVGLAVQDTNNSGPIPGEFDSYRDELRMARDTGALAPPGGVDCDGNGTTDVLAGTPLVCRIQLGARLQVNLPGGLGPTGGVQLAPAPPLHLGSAITQLAQGLPENRAVRLTISGPASYAHVVNNAAPTVNVRADNLLGFVVQYNCPRASKPSTWHLTVSAQVGVRSLASAPMTLTCTAVPVAIPLSVAPADPPAPVAARPHANPPANLNVNGQPNPGLNLNGGLARQDQKQPMLAAADADQGEAEQAADVTELAMSRPQRTPDAVWLVGASMLTAAAAGYATRQRWWPAYQHCSRS